MAESAKDRLRAILAQRHDRALSDLLDARRIVEHPTEKGDLTERTWLEIIQRYLPNRYQARRAIVIDHRGSVSDQIDIVVHDSIYTPFILEFGGYDILPVESVYAVLEVKQVINRANLNYAHEKARSVLALNRANRSTNEIEVRDQKVILTGLLASQCGWKSPHRQIERYRSSHESGRSLNYVLSASSFIDYEYGQELHFDMGPAPITRFILRFVSHLQQIGTVHPIDIEQYLSALDG